MPKVRGARGRKANADAKTIESVQKIQPPLPDQPTRPRTRAWVKQEKSKGEEAIDTQTSAVHQSPPRGSGRQRGVVSENLSPVPAQARNQRTVTGASIKKGNRRPAATRVVNTNEPSTSRRQTNTITPTLQQERGEPGTRREKSRSGQLDRKAAPAPAKQNQNQHREIELVVSKEPQQVEESVRPQTPTLAAWLSGVESVTPKGKRRGQALYLPPASNAHNLEDGMESSTTTKSTKSTGDGESTAKATGSKSFKLSEVKLRYRRVSRKPSTDEKLAELGLVLKNKLPDRPLDDINDLQTAAQDFLRQIAHHPKDSCYPYIDDFSYKFDEGKSKICYPVINRRYFDHDLRRCLARNEAVLQRTIMIHIINHYWLGKKFDWNSEGQWSLDKDSRLPSREDDEVTLPKPDLAISFTLESFTGEDDSDPIPPELERCISPDGGDRCFPFLFFEVKKACSDLQEAYMANLHSASQALYNMYNWMVRAEQEETFFDTVRVFSLVFNAQDLGVRVHRAEKMSDEAGTLRFYFDDLWPLARYTKDRACLLIQTILADYAEKELHPALQTAFSNVIKQEDERVKSKRRANPERNASSKRPRRDRSAIQESGQSFAMSNLAT